MKKVFIFIALSLAVSLVSCEKTTNYKNMGEEMAKQLESLCETNDVDAVVALDDSIRAITEQLTAQGDTASLRLFSEGLGDVRDKVAPVVTVAKMQSGTSKQEAVQDVIDDVLNGRGGDVSTVAKSIKAALEEEKKSAATEAPEKASKE